MTDIRARLQTRHRSLHRQVFEQNYEELRLDSGHAVTPHVKETALQQVLLYWRVLHEVAENVTDTEVRLSLPGRKRRAGAITALKALWISFVIMTAQ
jgi:hypothetical protein